MASFVSWRFDEDALLEEILNDPDTGTKKLQAGSPPESVKKVQQALFDLTWTQRIDPPVSDRSQFVIGTYGPLTTKTVKAYKTRYDIRFPPGDPNGFIDGLTGPRTLAKLDRHCVLFDLCDAKLAGKAAEVRNATGREHDSPTLPILGTKGAMRLRSGGGLPGIPSGLWFKKGLGTFEVSGPIFIAYQDKGSESGDLGFPFTDQQAGDAPGRFLQEFEGGEIRFEDGQTFVLFGNPPNDMDVSADSF
ncbi:hypothetical protein [Nocardia sp. NPDC050793]|uniref:hypothetical protein n=1 Tax=Nocardia sp. NPDC050793 TaxID=3155159 RepID=UPI0033D74286